MAGTSFCSQEKLNKTLIFLASLLNKHNITNWFIAYGTLLGIIRENSCIDNDDDIDIICNRNDYDKIKELLSSNGFTFEYGYDINTSKDILKTKETSEYVTIDFYMAEINYETGDYKDNWEKVTWSKCFDKNKQFIEKEWNDVTLFIPHDFETKLEKRYGKNWRIPANFGGYKHDVINIL